MDTGCLPFYRLIFLNAAGDVLQPAEVIFCLRIMFATVMITLVTGVLCCAVYSIILHRAVPVTSVAEYARKKGDLLHRVVTVTSVAEYTLKRGTRFIVAAIP